MTGPQMVKRRWLLKALVAATGMPAFGSALAATAKRPLKGVDLEFIGKKMALIRRSVWTEVKPKPWRVRAAGGYDRLTVHHTGLGVNTHTDKHAVMADMESVLALHLERNYGDIGYHFAVDAAGRAWECRSLAYEGAHVANENEGNIGVMLLGNFEAQDVAGAQLAGMKLLVELLRKEYRIKKHRLYGHRDLGKTACPGKILYPHVRKLRS